MTTAPRTRSFTVREMPVYRAPSGTGNRQDLEYAVDDKDNTFLVPREERVFSEKKS
jgi:hypothetical protein